jgi:diguanylate cyclase (GGDEF)-like protein
MGAKTGITGALAAALLWTAGLAVTLRLPLQGSAAYWRLKVVIFMAWILGLLALWLLFKGRQLSTTAGSRASQAEDSVDTVTGLPTRSSFRETVLKYMDSCGEEDEKCLVVLICVKDFDKIAGSHGDEEAEKVIARVSKALLDCFRGGDILGRHDKDEMAVFLPGAAGLYWDKISGRIHQNVAAQNKQFEKPYVISVNAGHCEFDPASPAPMEILLRRAYEEMIRDMGKDRQ